MSVTPETFNPELVTVCKPVKHTGDNEYCTLSILYGGRKIKNLMPWPGVYCNPIGSAPKNPHKLTQGISHDTPESVKMAEEATLKIWEGFLQHCSHEDMPKFCRNMKTVEQIYQARDLGVNVKGILHYPEKRDEKGNPTGERDPEATPKCYARLIRSGPNHPENPGKIWTRYYSASILDAEVAARIKEGSAQESDYTFDALDLMKKKLGMKAMVEYSPSDIYVAAGNIIIRTSLNEVYVVGFEKPESQAKKALKSMIAESGIKIEGPSMVLPDFNEEDSPTTSPPNSNHKNQEQISVGAPSSDNNSNEPVFNINVTE